MISWGTQAKKLLAIGLTACYNHEVIYYLVLCADTGPLDREVKTMNKYEALFIIKPDLEAEANKAVIDKFTSVITNGGGAVVKVDEWGKKKLAYPINYIKEGFYVLITFDAEPTVPAELERNFRTTEDIMRYLVVLREN